MLVFTLNLTFSFVFKFTLIGLFTFHIITNRNMKVGLFHILWSIRGVMLDTPVIVHVPFHGGHIRRAHILINSYSDKKKQRGWKGLLLNRKMGRSIRRRKVDVN